MDTVTFLIVFSILTIIYCILGFVSSRNVNTMNDYFLANRDLGLLSVTFTLIATQLGGGLLLGTSQQAYTVGLFGLLYTLGIIIGFMLLSFGIAARLRSLNVATTSEIFETKYNSPVLKKFSALLSVITMGGILTSQIVGSKMVLAGLNIQNELIFLAFWIFIIAYTVVGGLRAVVVTDIFQVLYIMVVFGGIFIYSLFAEPSSFFSIDSLTMLQQTYFASSTLSSSQLISILLMPALFSLIEQDLAQRFFAARTRKIATFSALCSSIFLISFSLIPIYFGMKAKLLGVSMGTQSPLIAVVGVLTNEFVLILALCGIIAAITSTADSLLCAISSLIAQSFELSWTRIDNKLRLSQLVTLIVGFVVLAASYLVPSNIIGILIESYALSVNCLLIPLLFAYYRTDLKKSSAIGAIMCSFIGYALMPLFGNTFGKELLPLVFSFIGFIAGIYWPNNQGKQPLRTKSSA